MLKYLHLDSGGDFQGEVVLLHVGSTGWYRFESDLTGGLLAPAFYPVQIILLYFAFTINTIPVS